MVRAAKKKIVYLHGHHQTGSIGYRNQIDYILINKRWKSTIRDVTTKPGPDCGTDHELLVAILKMKLKKLRKKGDRINVYDCKGITPEYRMEIIKEQIRNSRKR